MEKVCTPRDKVSQCVVLEELRAVVHHTWFLSRNGLVQHVELQLPVHLQRGRPPEEYVEINKKKQSNKKMALYSSQRCNKTVSSVTEQSVMLLCYH